MSNQLRHLHMGCGESLRSSTWLNEVAPVSKPVRQPVQKAVKTGQTNTQGKQRK
ncbi:MAG: hypothetical protein OEY07_14480 [Gammaproteobacteria bacterium]|nr:hypothetical protein [Gammaproteobacteria bacterium]